MATLASIINEPAVPKILCPPKARLNANFDLGRWNTENNKYIYQHKTF
jgi:hypothetical protein